MWKSIKSIIFSDILYSREYCVMGWSLVHKATQLSEVNINTMFLQAWMCQKAVKIDYGFRVFKY